MTSSRRLARGKPWLALVAAWLLLGLLAMTAAGETARRQAEAELSRQAEAAAALHAAVLRSELEKHRSLPLVLAQDPEVIALLETGGGRNADLVNRKMELLEPQTRAAAIYVLDREGVARAASNWRLPTSFVGSDYSFRPYFADAVRNGEAEFFALGTVSGRPGLYLSRRVATASGRLLGVVVAKVEFDALEAEWRASGEPAYVADARGVVLVTSVPRWRFRTVRPLDEAQKQAILAGQTLDANALSPLPFRIDAAAPSGVVAAPVAGTAGRWVAARTPTTTPGWTLHLLTPVGDAILSAVASARAVAGLIVTLIAGGAAVLLRRRQQALAHARAEEAARAELERLIDERTVELRSANTELSREIDERRRAEASREALRDELVQANKLATLGQIAAGVAHEINQPVAAIRTHADTAATYLDRQDPSGVRRTLGRIGDLTSRIGAITDELRAFSRKTAAKPSAISPDAAIDGALLLLGGRLRESRIQLTRTPHASGLKVVAERIRLEQVVVNLIQNALEALDEAQGTERTLDIRVVARSRFIDIVITDSGPGLAPDVVAQLFTPFVTTKSTGLGLGLVICRDIVAGFGGELNLKPVPQGARFVISLRKA